MGVESSVMESVLSGTVSGVSAGLIVAALLALTGWIKGLALRRKQIAGLRETIKWGRAKILAAEDEFGTPYRDEQSAHWFAMNQQLKMSLENSTSMLTFNEVQSVRERTTAIDGLLRETTLGTKPGVYAEIFRSLRDLKWLKLPDYEKGA